MGKRLQLTPGQRFYNLTVISDTGESKPCAGGSKRLWLFRCDCGIEVIKTATEVKRGVIKSCGCKLSQLKNNKRNPLTGAFLPFDDTEGQSCAEKVWKANHYSEDGCPFETFLLLSQQSCHYCGVLNSCSYINKRNNETFYYNGLDRKDSLLDHSPDNLVPCCKDCNMRKGAMGYQEFLGWIKRAYTHLHS